MMKRLRFAAAVALSLLCAPALAQWQTPNHSVPIGKGGGVTGFGAAVPSVAGRPLVDNGAGVDPGFGTIANSGFTAGAADTVKGSLNGTTVTDIPLPSCTGVNQTLRYTLGVGPNCGVVTVQTGFDMPINLGLSASAGAGALTLSVTQSNGSAPTSGNPVLVPFRSTTLTTGSVTWSTIASALSVTIPSSATLGTSNGVPFRIWIFLDANAGTPSIGVATCSTPTALFPCASWEHTLKTSITLSAGATAAGTLYATAGVTLDSVRIIGFCDFASGLATAGTWASACTTLQVLGPGMKKPGDLIQTVKQATGTAAVGSTIVAHNNTNPQISAGDQYMSQAITPVSNANILSVRSQGFYAVTTSATYLAASLYNPDISATNSLATSYLFTQSTASPVQLNHAYMTRAPTAGVATTFSVRAGGTNGNVVTFNGESSAGLYGGALNSYLEIQEIMGFNVQEPANDNINPGAYSKVG